MCVNTVFTQIVHATYIHVHTYSTYAYMHTHIYIYTYMYVHIYVHTYIHTYTHVPLIVFIKSCVMLIGSPNVPSAKGLFLEITTKGVIRNKKRQRTYCERAASHVC